MRGEKKNVNKKDKDKINKQEDLEVKSSDETSTDETSQAQAEDKAEEEALDEAIEDLKEDRDLADALAKAQEEIERLKDSRIRLMAEFDNYKRRTQKEKERIYADALVDVSQSWLPILDNLDRASNAADMLDEQSDMDAIKSVAQGIDLIQKQAETAMDKLGIEEIDCLHKPFDPNLQEAVMRQDSDEYEPETVVEVLAKGYIYKDRVIRHAVVKVAN